MKSIIIRRGGGPEVLEVLDGPDPVAGPGQVLVEVLAAGVNFMDLGVRQGRFWTGMDYPRTLGVEGAGRILALGQGVAGLDAGQRVAWAYAPGSYAGKVAIDAGAVVPVPDGVSERAAAALILAGITASHFATEFYPVQPGDVALVHAAAGGVGQLLTQIIKLRGGTVIGRVSSEAKARVARAAGADHVIVDTEGSFAEQARALTGGEGVHVVFDGSGPATFQGSLDALRVAGTFCWYGPVLGGPGALDIMSLPRAIKIGYANFSHHVATPALLRARAGRLFDWLVEGKLKIDIGQVYPLAEAARAHADMESRASSGKLLLIP